jgi:NAD(P)-dependent dehydrogenase (short-subunit alcohol dehydrogenase family)
MTMSAPRLLDGSRIIVTGATYGMGSSVAEILVTEGAQVVAMGRSAELGENLAARHAGTGAGVLSYVQCDVAIRAQVEAAFARATGLMGGLHALVHVAGVASSCEPEHETDETWHHVFEINARGTFHTNQEAFRYLKRTGGSIINFGSNAGIAGVAQSAAYSASKGAVVAWTRAVAQAWAQYRVRANVIAPVIRTPMYEAARMGRSPEERAAHDARTASAIPLGGAPGDPALDLAPVVTFLCSEAAGFITGQTFAVDGGRLMVR